MVIIAQRGICATRHRLLEAWRNGEVAIHLPPLHRLPSLRIIGIVSYHIERRHRRNVPHNAARRGRVILIHDADGQTTHLSITKDGGHEEDQEQRQHYRCPQIDAARGHATPFAKEHIHTHIQHQVERLNTTRRRFVSSPILLPEDETLGNLVQKFRSRLAGKPCGLLTRHRDRRSILSKLKNLLTQKLTFRLLSAFS